jgi:hypothetical protein
VKTTTSIAALVATAGLLVLAACGGGGSTPTSPGTSVPVANSAQGSGSRGRFSDPAVQECLAAAGVTTPAPGDANQGSAGTGGPPAVDPALRQALQNCGVGGGFGGGRGALDDPAVQQCLAGKGITLPARGQGGNGQPAPASTAAPGQQPTRPTFDAATQQAIQECRALATTTTPPATG